MNLQFIILSITTMILFFAGCGANMTDNTNGGATETVNAKVFVKDSSVIVELDANDEISADIVFIDAEYNPVENNRQCDSVSLFSSKAGVLFKGKTGMYNVLIHEKKSLKSLFFQSISLGKDKCDTLSDTLSGGSTLKGNIQLSAKSGVNGSRTQSVIIFLKGTPWFYMADSSYSFSFTNIPGGTFTITATAEAAGTADNINHSVNQNIDIGRDGDLKEISIFFSE